MKKLITILLFSVLTLNAQVGDCPAQYMCIGGNFTAVVDVTDELNGVNQGCLASNEGTTSYWVQICALTAGTIQFTIAPSGSNNDYDWAVYNGSNCPPTAAPIRCSYAVSAPGPGGDNTGVNSILNAPQTDNSEGVFGNQWTQDINAAAGQCFTISINNYGTGSNNFGLTFGGTAVLDCGPLPIELLFFNGNSIDASTSILTWSTAIEINSMYYDLEWSKDGLEWLKIAQITAAGNSNVIQEYSYVHSTTELLSYYRLKQVDINGLYRYYDPICIVKPTVGTVVSTIVYDINGKIITDFNNSSKGMYIIYMFYSDNSYKIKKIIK